MAEYRLTAEPVPWVSTREFHADRPRAPHVDQPNHRPRLEQAALFVEQAAFMLQASQYELAGLGARLPEMPAPTVSDLGCGDGGLLSLLADPGRLPTRAWGYDFCPANMAGWADRDVTGELIDVFGADRDRVRFGEITVMTEVLEHLADPHGVVRWVSEHSPYLVCSSPWTERPDSHDECHAWAWDFPGYRALVEQAGYRVLDHIPTDWFQVLLAWKP